MDRQGTEFLWVKTRAWRTMNFPMGILQPAGDGENITMCLPQFLPFRLFALCSTYFGTRKLHYRRIKGRTFLLNRNVQSNTESVNCATREMLKVQWSK